MANSIVRRLLCAGAIILIVLPAGSVRAQQQMVSPPRPAPPPVPVGTAAITGVVVDAVGDRPIGEALVSLEYRRPGLPRQTFVQITTPKGRFAFVDLPAGDTFFLTTFKAGYLEGGNGRTVPMGPIVPLSVKDGQWVSDVRVAMSKPGSISGSVADERGEPIVGATVRVLPQIQIAGRPQWLAGAAARTDDRGVFRIPGLGPGKYVVSVPSVQATLPSSATIKPPTASAGTSMADLRAASEAGRAEKMIVDAGGGQQLVVGRYAVAPPPSDGRRSVYAIAFFPGVAAPADAGVIELRAGEDRLGVDFQLQPVKTARVSGAVLGPPDAVGNLLLRLIPVGLEELGQGSEAATTVTSPDGHFTFLDVPAGSYVLDSRHTLMELAFASTSDASTALPAPVPFPAVNAASFSIGAAPPGVQASSLNDGAAMSYWGQLRVEVSGRDVDDVSLQLRRPASLSGRWVWAPDAKPTANTLPRPRLEPADGRRLLSTLQMVGASPADGIFVIEGMMAGDYLLRVPGVTVESVTWDSQDYTDRPFDATSGRDFTGVVVTLTTISSGVSGIVTDGSAPLTASAAVIAFPQERERWSRYGFNPTRLTSVLTTADGHFRVDGLPSGDYYFVAVPIAQERAWLDPAFLATHAGLAARVHLDGNTTKVDGVVLRLVK